ncbi:xanthine/uracil/vitamin C transporter [Ameyamaea chiangmaiensis NBRC 103196]|uniref:NCS2 family permease n=1 Tax=Ameyamaea chiangmaiensis TaxID=442969 RepID=A0A850P9I3_9PROT|nr:NCS2 family permease [Ameyamaea chiangmaiensis]MBS4075542.1 NCS2 family permease [Ameyamaea chiangmaiensis]NVN41265.1 NCS2 family permease [Ameyamaea chiangmaiensis]GBQ69381.1 xanthine/uracil/vitamin C transporter [Ameyamaea chiangmaiensis NBRC 103196]
MRELVAGLTTFGAMAYIMAVNPAILAMAGLDRHDMIMTTIAAAVIGTLLMALWANLPIALAPAMSSNIVFAQIVVVHMGVPPRVAFTIVLLSGLAFTLLSLTNSRGRIIQGFPEPIIDGIRFAIGAFIARIGMTTGGLAIPSHEGLAFGSMANPTVLLCLGGLVMALVLTRARVPAAMLLTIVTVTVLGAFIPGPDGHTITHIPARAAEWPRYPTHMLFPFDFHGFADHLLVLVPVTLYFFLSDFFDATGTMLAVTRRAGLEREDGQPVLGRAAFTSDGAASVIGSSLGTCTVSAYLESLVGVEAGGRTGLVGVVVAVLFALSSFFWPLITAIPAVATAPVLIVVGLDMLSGLPLVSRSTLTEMMAPLLMVVITLLTGNFMISLACGLLLHTALMVAGRQWRGLTPMLLGLDAVFLMFLVLETRMQS